MKRRAGPLAVLAACCGLLACGGETPVPLPLAEVGVFYGGQVQQTKVVEVGRVHPPQLGVRVRWPENVITSRQDVSLVVEVTRPGAAGRRVVERTELTFKHDRERVDHLLRLEPEDRLGTWNVRVEHPSALLADRAILLKPSL